MSSLSPREIVLAQLRHEETDPVPFSVWFEGDVAERLDAFYGTTHWRDRLPPYMVSVGCMPSMVRIPEGPGLERDLFGSLWRTDQRPFHLEEPGIKEPSFDGYDWPGLEKMTDPNLQRDVERNLADYPHSFTMVNVPWGMWEGVWGIRGFENSLVDIVAEPDFFEELLDRLTEIFLHHVRQAEPLRCDALMFGDDWGDQRGVTVGPDRWRKLFKPRFAKIFDAVHAQGKYVIHHCCGSTIDILDDMIEIGIDVYESVQPEARGMNPYELKKRFGDRITFWGCLGSQSTMPFGTPDEIRAEVQRLKTEMGKGGGFILQPAKALQPETPTENAVAFIEAALGEKVAVG